MSKTRLPLILLARLAIVGASILALVAAALLLLSGRVAGMPRSTALTMLGLLACMAVGAGIAAARLGSARAIRLAVPLVVLGVVLYGAEVLIRILAPEVPSLQYARRLDAERQGVPFDPRSKSEVVAEMRKRGIDAQPAFSRYWLMQPRVRQQLPDGFVPLSQASNAEIVECNESGHYLVFHSDEYGFNNPPGLVASGALDAAAIGTSFTVGHCVSAGKGIIAGLRHSYPRLANFGVEGGKALSMLGTFREYVEPLKPPVVLWIMHPWTVDASDELADPVLKRYLEPGFSQHLRARRSEVDEVVRSFAMPVQYEFDRRTQVAVDALKEKRFVGVLTLAQLRRRLHFNDLMAKPPAPPDLEAFRRSIDLARRATESWGGRFVVVIMPLYAEVVAHDLAAPLHHDHLASLLQGMGVEVIDTVPAFEAAEDPASLYVMRRDNHPTDAGQRLLANLIDTRLRAQAPPRATLAHQGVGR